MRICQNRNTKLLTSFCYLVKALIFHFVKKIDLIGPRRDKLAFLTSISLAWKMEIIDVNRRTLLVQFSTSHVSCRIISRNRLVLHFPPNHQIYFALLCYSISIGYAIMQKRGNNNKVYIYLLPKKQIKGNKQDLRSATLTLN